MKILIPENQTILQEFSIKNCWKAFIALVLSLSLTITLAVYSKNNLEEIAYNDFIVTCNEIRTELLARLQTHAQLLRSGAAFFAASDTVTREEWRKFTQNDKIRKELPGIQGVGYTIIVPKNKLNQHIQYFRNNGFPDYNVTPAGEREIYTSIIYLEPFSGRNLRAFGYDMFSEPIRRKAMELARDSDFATLSGKVVLIQETDENVQAGTLMYVPVYRNGMSANTPEERRAAIKGWVYSPYRMTDLTHGILGNMELRQKKQIQFKIFDNNNISEEALLYNSSSSKSNKSTEKPNLYIKLPVEFNGKTWTLQFAMKDESISFFTGEILIIIVSGLAISFLIFALSIFLINARLRSRQMLNMNNQLERLNTNKDRFISILAHDLKSPFSALLGFSELLATEYKQYNTKEVEEHINIIYKSAKNIYTLLEDLLFWAKTQYGKIPYEPECLSLSTIYSEVIDYMTFNADNKNILINHLPSAEQNVYADKNILYTILRNLISNAIKFTERGGKIDIVTESSGSQVTITVSDNGIGIEKETISKLFDISQIHTTEGTEQEKGTGLGLLLCKELVEIQGGKIWVESTPGKGSDFKFTLQKCYL